MPVSLFLIKLLAFMMEAASIGVDFNLDTRITTKVKTSSPSNRTTARWRTALKDNYHVMSLSSRNVNKEWTFSFSLYLPTLKPMDMKLHLIVFSAKFWHLIASSNLLGSHTTHVTSSVVNTHEKEYPC